MLLKFSLKEKFCEVFNASFFEQNHKFGSPSQGSEHSRMFRRHFAEATFPSTLRYKPVSESVFKNLKPVLAGRFWIFLSLCFENQFQNRFHLSETGLYQEVLENVGGAKWLDP